MKKFILMTFAFLAMSFAVQAQTVKEQLEISQKRAAELQSLCNDYPKSCGNDKIDNYGEAIKNAASFAILNSMQLDSLYKRQIGQTVDGVTDVTVKKPTLEEWITLSTTILGEGTSVNQAVDQATSAGEEAKNLGENASKEKNPMKAAKAAKTAKAASAIVTFGNKATPILLEETAAQAKAVQQIIETIKSGKNL